MNYHNAEKPQADFAENLADNGKGFDRWDTLKGAGVEIRRIYQGVGDKGKSQEYHKKSEAIAACANWLVFGLNDETEKIKLRQVNLCRLRHCPVCAWRKSMKWQARFKTALPLIEIEQPKIKWVFLTLTIKNCALENLRENIKLLNDSFKMMTRDKKFPAVGWLKSVEVTKSNDDTAHPHLHVLMMVNPSYYGRGYLQQSEWREMWKKHLKVDYLPSVNLRAVKTIYTKGFAEVTKSFSYSIKPEKMVLDPEWFLELEKQLKGSRDISTGGLMKKYLAEAMDEWAQRAEDEELEESAKILKQNRQAKYEFNEREKKYVRVEHLTREAWAAASFTADAHAPQSEQNNGSDRDGGKMGGAGAACAAPVTPPRPLRDSDGLAFTFQLSGQGVLNVDVNPNLNALIAKTKACAPCSQAYKEELMHQVKVTNPDSGKVEFIRNQAYDKFMRKMKKEFPNLKDKEAVSIMDVIKEIKKNAGTTNNRRPKKPLSG